MKSQIIIEQETKKILCTHHGKGKVHDFKLLKISKTRLPDQVVCLADKGYQGIQKIHEASKISHKKKKKKKLSLEQKKYNRDLASIRIVIEHVYRCLKIFRILSERYRNRRTRFSLRFNSIAGIYNYELSLSQNS